MPASLSFSNQRWSFSLPAHLYAKSLRQRAAAHWDGTRPHRPHPQGDFSRPAPSGTSDSPAPPCGSTRSMTSALHCYVTVPGLTGARALPAVSANCVRRSMTRSFSRSNSHSVNTYNMPKGRANLQKLETETPNKASANLDTLSALEIAQIINQQDLKVAYAVRRELANIAKAIDAVASSVERGGRLIYVGAGTSGRLGALDASEIPPTFNTPPDLVQFIIAGGVEALYSATEGSEDSREQGSFDIAARRPTRLDTVIGLTASGRTPYTMAALEFARSRGATTIAIACNKKPEIAKISDIMITLDVGPEVVTGSTRMKAGTAQKLVCNMITTGAMARLGYVYGNLMVNVHMKNQKLMERGIAIVERITGANRDDAAAALDTADQSVPVALVMLKAGVSKGDAQKRLKLAK